jgi:hypothetical protein
MEGKEKMELWNQQLDFQNPTLEAPTDSSKLVGSGKSDAPAAPDFLHSLENQLVMQTAKYLDMISVQDVLLAQHPIIW